MTYGQQFEDQALFKPKLASSDNAKHLFATDGSHGANPKKLAQLLVVWDFTMDQLDWEVKLSSIVTDYQASIDTHYHNDYKAVATIEELDKRLAKRRTSAYKQQGLISE